MPQRVLILSASAGAGHVRAAEALVAAFGARKDCIVEHFDAVPLTSKLFQKIYHDAYLGMIRRAPGLMGLLYDRFDQPWVFARRRLALDRLNTRPMIKLLKKVQPDLCIATHFLPSEIIAWLRAKKKLQARHTVVVTDFDVHAMWLCRSVDRYYVAVEESAEYLANLGVPREIIQVTGIPIDPVFAAAKDKREMRRKHGLDPERTTLLIAAGGYGVGPMERLVTDLLACGRPWQIVAIAGKSEKVRARLAGLARSGNASLHVVGFTNEMDEWMAAADVLVGKAGGLTTSEALARGLPLVLVEPIPGQEERNSDHLLEHGAGIRCNNLPAAAWKIAKLLDDPARLGKMGAAARAMARPDAAAKIVEDSVKLMENG